MVSKSCVCFGRSSSEMEPSTPVPCAVAMDEESMKPRGLVRKKSKLQTHVEVLRCRLGKPAAESDRTLGPSKNWTPIYYAVYHQREGALSHFLRAGSSPDDVDGTGQPPLCIAVANGCTGIVRILLDAGANVDATTVDAGETALHIAIKTDRFQIVELLLEVGPELEAHTTESHETPLHYAASKSGSLATVVTLLKLGAKYDALNSRGQSPAEAALLANNIKGAIAIINAARGRRNRLIKEKGMLLKYVEKGQTRFSIGNELIADIFAAACDPDSTVLVEAIKRDDAGLVEMFLSNGADPDCRTASGDLPIFVALDCAGAAVVKTLVKYKANVTLRNTRGFTVLQAAFEGRSAQDQEGISAIFDCLLARNADAAVTYADGKTLLHRAVFPGFGYAKIAHLLINASVRVNAQDNDGNTALHLATHSKSCMELLLKKGANLQKKNSIGLTPLLYATTHVDKEQEPDLEVLIKASDLRTTDRDGQTALHIAAANGLAKTLRVLLKARVDTSIVDSRERTSLLMAVLNHQWHIVPLLTIPPSINSWDQEGMTALHHIAMSLPKAPLTWKDIAAAALSFCERGVSRSMRERSGATPLILAVKMLPEEGLAVIDALLMQGADERNSWNCVGHEDHVGHDALYYAASLRKTKFVEALLKNGASFTFKDWVSGRSGMGSSILADKRITELIAQYEWARRAGTLRRQFGGDDMKTKDSPFAMIFPVTDLHSMITMGLDLNALPKTGLGSSLLWAVLRQIPLQPPLSPKYVLEALKLMIQHNADPNVSSARGGRRSPSPQASTQDLPLNLHALTFLLEECPAIDADIITLLLTKGAKLSLASPFYCGRYPLHSAVKANRIDLVDEFLLQRADANVVDQYGWTPLFIAAEKGFWEITDTLLRGGAKVEMIDNEGNTSLHFAATRGSKRIVSTLVRAGAKAGIKNDQGRIPLARVPDTLELKEKEKIIHLLKDAEEKERRTQDRTRQAVVYNTVQDATTKQRSVEDAKENQRRAHENEERQRKEQETSQQRPKEFDKQRQVSSPQPPNPPPKRSLLFRTPSLFSRRPKASPPPSSIPAAPKIEVSIRVNTPPSSKYLDVTTVQTTSKPANVANTSHKRGESPRIDSGLGQKRPCNVDKPLPVLDRSKSALDGKSEANKRDSSATELADWLALSRMMDRM